MDRYNIYTYIYIYICCNLHCIYIWHINYTYIYIYIYAADSLVTWMLCEYIMQSIGITIEPSKYLWKVMTYNIYIFTYKCLDCFCELAWKYSLMDRKSCHKMCTYGESWSAKLPNLPQVYQLISPWGNMQSVCVHACVCVCKCVCGL